MTDWPLAPRFQPDYFIPEVLEPALIEVLRRPFGAHVTLVG
jgi:hypothetical protein